MASEQNDDEAGTEQLTHYTVIMEGMAGKIAPDFSCPSGPAFMGIKVWARSTQHAALMAKQIGKHVGFTAAGQTSIYKTDPVRPCGDKPFGYDIQFTPFDG